MMPFVRLPSFVSLLLYRVVVVSLALLVLMLAGRALGQTRTVTWDGATLRATSLHCSPSNPAADEWNCSLCASVQSDGGAELADCVTMDVKGTTNVNRLNALANSLSARWLNRQGFPVDAGPSP